VHALAPFLWALSTFLLKAASLAIEAKKPIRIGAMERGAIHAPHED
jgi:hypothetical protein